MRYRPEETLRQLRCQQSGCAKCQVKEDEVEALLPLRWPRTFVIYRSHILGWLVAKDQLNKMLNEYVERLCMQQRSVLPCAVERVWAEPLWHREAPFHWSR